MHQSVIIYTREYELSAENICTAVETHSEKEDQRSLKEFIYMNCGIPWFNGSFYLWFWKDISLYYIYFKIQMNIGWAYKNVKNIQATVERFVKLFSREMELSSRKVTQLLYTLIWSPHGMITFFVFNQLKEKQTKMNWWSKSSFRYCNTHIVLTFLMDV